MTDTHTLSSPQPFLTPPPSDPRRHHTLPVCVSLGLKILHYQFSNYLLPLPSQSPNSSPLWELGD